MHNTPPSAASFQVVAHEGVESPAAEHVRRLRELSETMDGPNNFRPGQLVRWKRGLKNRHRPDYNERAIVRAVLPTPLFDGADGGRDSGTPIFCEPLTIVLGVLDEDGDFLEYHFDGRRFELAED